MIFNQKEANEAIIGLDVAGWFLDPLTDFVNKGSVVEALVGQEMLAYGDPYTKKNLYYWHREVRGSEAEIDYLITIRHGFRDGGQNNNIIPVEVKSGAESTLRSMHSFLESHAASPYGIRFSTQNYGEYQKIKPLPLYAVSQVMSGINQELKKAIEMLVQ